MTTTTAETEAQARTDWHLHERVTIKENAHRGSGYQTSDYPYGRPIRDRGFEGQSGHIDVALDSDGEVRVLTDSGEFVWVSPSSIVAEGQPWRADETPVAADHPEFLSNREQYAAAPTGTRALEQGDSEDQTLELRADGIWYYDHGRAYGGLPSARRRVLRWGPDPLAQPEDNPFAPLYEYRNKVERVLRVWARRFDRHGDLPAFLGGIKINPFGSNPVDDFKAELRAALLAEAEENSWCSDADPLFVELELGPRNTEWLVTVDVLTRVQIKVVAATADAAQELLENDDRNEFTEPFDPFVSEGELNESVPAPILSVSVESVSAAS